MRTHLLIMNGPEKRDVILEECIRVSKPVFDCINIVQNGHVYGNPNQTINQYITYYNVDFIGYVAAYRQLLDGVRPGDYLLVLDSDEIPSTELLNFIAARDFDQNYNTFGMQFMHYQYDDEGKQKYVLDSGFGFCPSRFFRYEDGLDCYTYKGAHQQYRHVNPSVLCTPLHINHIKHDFAVLLSCFAHGVYSPESIGINCGEFEDDILATIRYRYKIFPDFIYKNFHDKELFSRIYDDIRYLWNSDKNVALEIVRAVEFVLSAKKDLVELYESDYNRPVQ